MHLKIAVLPGDGIGPEVIQQAIHCLEAIEESFGHTFTYKEAAVGALGIETVNDPLPKKTLELCKNSDAILFGAIGNRQFDHNLDTGLRPEHGLLKLRKELDLFANIRPVKAYKPLFDRSPLKKHIVENTDFIIYRELTGGIYFGEKKTWDEGRKASDVCEYSEKEISRIAHLAFKSARNRRNKLTLIDKANVLESSLLWRRVVSAIGQSYPEVTLEFCYVDHAAMRLVLQPDSFDVILTDNMFGDILSDEASVISGTIGLLPSASIGTKNVLFEPIHGSFSTAQGKNIANPIAAILSAAMLLEHFSLFEEAMVIREGVDMALSKGIVTPDVNKNTKYGTSHVGDFIADFIVDHHDEVTMNDENIGLGRSTII